MIHNIVVKIALKIWLFFSMSLNLDFVVVSVVVVFVLLQQLLLSVITNDLNLCIFMKTESATIFNYDK